MLKFIRQPDGDYEAISKGICYTICKSTDAGFGLSVWPVSGGREALPAEWTKLCRIGPIAWLRAKYRCEEWANKVDATVEEPVFVEEIVTEIKADPNIRAKSAPPVEGKPAWRGEYRICGEWKKVHSAHGPIAYAYPEAAIAGAVGELRRARGSNV